MNELDRIRPERDKHLEVSGGADGVRHRERESIRRSVVVSAGDGRFGVRAVRQQDRRAAGLLERLRGLDAFEARTQMDVVVEDGHASPNEDGLLGFPGCHATLGRNGDAFSKRAVHLLEAAAGVAIQAPGEQRDEQTPEAFPLNEPGTHRPERLNLKDVLAVEEAREADPAEPAQLAIRDDGLHGGSKSHWARTRRPEEHIESGTDQRLAANRSDERVPIRKPLEIEEDGPHAFGGRVDFDFGPKF